MRPKTIGWLIGIVWSGVGGILAVPLLIAVALGETWVPFAISVAVALGGGTLLLLALREAERALDHRSAFLAVSLTWLSICVLGALPYALDPRLDLPLVDAFFESVAGLTTTGATILSGLDAMPRSLLLWRSMSQWLGGMGIVIFGVAVLPLLGVGGMELYKAEAPGPTKDRMTPRIAETAKLLWVLYLGLTVAAGLGLWVSGMTGFDAICHAMTSIATGGFSTHDASIGHYDSGAIALVMTGVMLAGGTSFAILHRALTGGASWADQPELRAYVGIFALAVLVISVDLMSGMPHEFGMLADALQHASFQAASILTTSGFSTRDFDLWPATSHVTLFLLFFVGGMAGSTSGGVKVIRIVLLARLAFAQFFRLLHPRAFKVVRLGNRTLDDEVLVSGVGFIGMWLVLLGVGTALLSLFGYDAFTSLSAAAVSLANVGPGFGAVGPSRTFAELATGAKLVIMTLMLLGRLEIYTILIILTPGFWRR